MSLRTATSVGVELVWMSRVLEQVVANTEILQKLRSNFNF